MFTLVAWSESVDPAGAFTDLNATPDDHVTVVGDDVFVPEGMNQLIGAAGVVDMTVTAQVRLRSPSLLRRGYEHYLEPLASGLVPGAIHKVVLHPATPIELDANEALKAQASTNPASAVQHYVAALLADGPITPVEGEIRTVRATAAASLAANTWASSALTFPVSLPAGRFQVVGARCNSTNGVFFRLNFIASPWRPGGLCSAAQTDVSREEFRYGKLGVWGEFTNRTPPTIQVLGVTDTAQVVYLDLIQIE